MFIPSWLQRMRNELILRIGDGKTASVMNGCEAIDDDKPAEETGAWFAGFAGRFEEAGEPEKVASALQCCACAFDDDSVWAIKEIYAASETIQGFADEIMRRKVFGKSLAVRGNVLYITKRPACECGIERAATGRLSKTCHCPLASTAPVPCPKLFCNCGGGFYKRLFDELWQADTTVEPVTTFIHGDSACVFAVHIPEHVHTKQMINCIGRGAKTYLRSLAMSDTMQLVNENGIEWIAPKPGCAGPSLVYDVQLDERAAGRALGEWIAGIRAGHVPTHWFVSPDWTPGKIVDILLEKGFSDISNPEEPEPAMALELATAPVWTDVNPNVTVNKVESMLQFEAWCRIANEVLHGWDTAMAEHYSQWLQRADISLYIASIGDKPVTTVATVRDGKCASLEFVATLAEYRNRGAAAAACIRALEDLKAAGVEVATLRAFHDGVRLYEKLGFRTYYNTTMLSFPVKEG